MHEKQVDLSVHVSYFGSFGGGCGFFSGKSDSSFTNFGHVEKLCSGRSRKLQGHECLSVVE